MKYLLVLILIPLFNCSLFAQDLELDITFGDSGRVFIPIASDNESFPIDNSQEIALQSDGKIILGGVIHDNTGSSDWLITLVRLHPDGKLDMSFGDKGIAHMDIIDDDEFYAMAIQGDDKIVVVGRSWIGRGPDIMHTVMRFTADGKIDSSFHQDGLWMFDLPPNASSIHSVAIQKDGKIVIAGWQQSRVAPVPGSQFLASYWDLVALRLLPDGSLDKSFANDGKFTFKEERDQKAAARIVVQPDGRLLIGGRIDDKAIVLRLLDDGSFDTSFGINGLVEVYTGERAVITDIILDAQGRILCSIEADFEAVTARLNPDGSLDQDFGEVGLHVFQTNTNTITTAYQGLNLLPNGHIMGLGNFHFTSNFEKKPFNFLLLDNAGQAVSDFGLDGLKQYEVCDRSTHHTDFLVLADGAILVTGSCTGTPDDFLALKFKLTESVVVSNPNQSVRLYPNPATGTFKVGIPKEWVGEKIQVMNGMGQKIYDVVAKEGENEFQVPFGDAGMLIVNVNGKVSKLLVVGQ